MRAGEAGQAFGVISGAAQDQSQQLLSLEDAIDELSHLTRRNVENAGQLGFISEELQKNGEALRVFLGDIYQSEAVPDDFGAYLYAGQSHRRGTGGGSETLIFA